MPNEKELQKMFDEYKELYNNYGYSEKSLGWNKPKHLDRFSGVTKPWSHIKKEKNITILDYGCGLGHLYEFLKLEGFQWQYTGIDINKELIIEAKRIHPNVNFLATDINKINDDLKFDLIFIVGTFNRRFSDSDNLLQSSIKESLNKANLGVNLALLSPWALKKYKSNYYPNLSLLEKCVDRNKAYAMNIRSDVILGEIMVDFFVN